MQRLGFFSVRSSAQKNISFTHFHPIDRAKQSIEPKTVPLVEKQQCRPVMSASVHPPKAGDYDTSHSAAVRWYNGTYGLIPPAVEPVDLQVTRCLKQLAQKPKGIDKYLYLSGLRNTNVHLFYRLVVQHTKEIAPLIYTPTVGEACLQWSHNYVQPEGLYISYSDRGNIRSILDHWPEANVEITVITDGSRILGLG